MTTENTPKPAAVSTIDNEGLDMPMNDPMGTDMDGVSEGLTPMHPQNIDESRIDEVLVEDALDDKDYPGIRDIADNDAVAHSHNDDL